MSALLRRFSATVVVAFWGCGSSAMDLPAESTESPNSTDPSAAKPSGDAGASDAPKSETAPAERRIGILVFNVLHGFPTFANLDARTAMTAEAIVTLAPDFVLLQEVGQSSLLKNRAEVIGTSTGYEFHWTKASGVPGVFEEGPAILSKWPIKWRGGTVLPHTTNFGLAGRSACGITADTPFGDLNVYSTHLTNEGSVEIVADQAAAAFAFMTSRPSPLPSFLGGDMNSDPSDLSMKFFRGEASHKGATGNLVDAWTAVNPSEPGYTAPSSNPSHRIDYLLAGPGTSSTAKVEQCSLVLKDPEGEIYPSDHIGVFCKILLP